MSGRGKPDVSVTQLVAGALATATATVVASYFGVAGTLIGAAMMSVVSTGGAALYKHYLERGKSQIVDKMPTLGNRLHGEEDGEPDDPAAPFAAATETESVTVASAAGRFDDPNATRRDIPLPDATRLDLKAVPDEAKAGRPWPKWYVMAGASAAIFAVVIGGVAAYEGLTGKPLGRANQTLFSGDQSKSTPSPTPTTSDDHTSDTTRSPSPGTTGHTPAPTHTTRPPTTPPTSTKPSTQPSGQQSSKPGDSQPKDVQPTG